MPPKTVRVLRAAAEEARAARRWYRERNPDPADRFLAEYDRALERIADAPERWPTYVDGTRRILMRRFPYGVVYRTKRHVIEIVAVAHLRRKPDYWRRR